MDQYWTQVAIYIAIGFEGADENLLKVFIGAVRDNEERLIMVKDAELDPHQYLLLRLSPLQLYHNWMDTSTSIDLIRHY